MTTPNDSRDIIAGAIQRLHDAQAALEGVAGEGGLATTRSQDATTAWKIIAEVQQTLAELNP